MFDEREKNIYYMMEHVEMLVFCLEGGSTSLRAHTLLAILSIENKQHLTRKGSDLLLLFHNEMVGERLQGNNEGMHELMVC